MEHIFDSKLIERVGKALVKLSNVAPEWLVTETPFMAVCMKGLLKAANPVGQTRRQWEENQRLAHRLGFKESQYNLPGIEWGHTHGYRFPLVLATWEQRLEYMQDRHRVQVEPELVAQVDHIFRRRPLPPAVLPQKKLLWWLRSSIMNTPAHWYATRTEDGRAIQIDFSTICDEIDHESADCKYNVRDVQLSDDDTLTINALTRLKSVVHLTAAERDTDRRNLEHAVFLTLTLINQANQVSYHNWIHFYYNDLVLYNVQSHFPTGHWVRRLLDPHMKYQNVLNNAGMFSRFPSDIRSYEVYDDVLFGGNLSSWTMGTFNTNIIDKSLGYYQKADYSNGCRETRGLDFNLNRLGDRGEGQMAALVGDLERQILAFVGEVIDRSATEADDRTLSLVCNNVLKFLHAGCLDGLPPGEDGTRDIFKRIVARYILQAGILHALEHFSMYFWFAPLRLPQRIRKMFDPTLALEDYSYPIDKQNGCFGHDLFTRYKPNLDNTGNWQSLSYDFADPALANVARNFVRAMQQSLIDYDAKVLGPARDVLSANGIPFSDSCVLTPTRVGCSIKM